MLFGGESTAKGRRRQHPLSPLAYYAGVFEFPVIRPTRWIPNRLIAFSKAVSNTDYDQWVHFFEDDYLFERIWRNPKKYLDLLKRYNGVILPDFSLYRDMPFVMQLWNIYRSRAIGFWLQLNGIKVIVNVRYADRRTYRCCCDGISRHCVIAIGTHGTIKNFNYFDENTGMTNLERTRSGKAPIGNDGNPIQLHHVIQKEAGPMVEIREVTHQEYYRILHGLVPSGASFRNDPLMNKQYNNVRIAYWKWRAQQYMKGQKR